MKLGIGIDIGGTKISVLLGNQNGKILSRREIPTLKNKKVKLCIGQLIRLVQDILNEKKISPRQLAGIGVGIPGPVNSEKGIVPKSPHLHGWKGVPLASILRRRFHVPVFMTNDANAAVLGESLFGCGKKAEQIIYLTVSTGIGGGVIANGRLLEGVSYVGAEIGHMNAVPDGALCPCGRSGCLEAYASGTAIAKFVTRELKKSGYSAKIKSDFKFPITARQIGEAAKKKNPLALAAYRYAGTYLGVGIGSLLNILNPEYVVLGGGVLKSAPKIHWQSMMKSIKKYAWPEAYKAVTIRRTSLGDHVGNLGALALVFDRKL